MRLRLIHIPFALVALLTLGSPLAVEGQNARPNVFFDCGGRNCNSQYFRTEIDWVNWVNDKEDADVHVIMTSQTTGAGGREYRLDFIGDGQAEDWEDTYLFQTLPTDTEREQLDGISHSLGIGIASYAQQAGFRGIVSLQGPPPESSGQGGTRLVSQDEVDDPWNLWVFRFNGSGNLDGESTRSTTRLNGSFSANRVTPTWKMNFNGNVNFNRIDIELEDGNFIDTRTDWGFNPLIVYSVADHWSIGLQGQSGRLTRFNQDFRAELTAAVEYSVFPYDEATRRALTFFYKIGPAYRNYIEPTIYNEMSELRFEQSLQVQLSQRQEWGDAGLTLTGSHFLHDTDLYNLALRGDIEFRIVRGFSVNARGDVAWVNDQVYLPLEDATDEETLLRLQQQATSFNYGIQVGFSIQFGSIFNNVVNNRFRGAGFGGFSGFGGGGGGRR
jgi:hypothetical protein